MIRKEFIRKSLWAAAGAAILPPFPARVFPDTGERVTILYTNDTHSRVDPFPENAMRHAGEGGMTRRASLIRSIRGTSPATLLLDAGDLFYGTPWFELYGGRVELRLMSEMRYDAMCLGEHELINGPDGFADVASEAEFPILCANYRVRETPLASHVQPYTVVDRGGIRFGIFGIGVRPFGLLDRDQYGGLLYGDPFTWAGRLAEFLRNSRRCDYVICLSHLGYRNRNGEPDDRGIASSVAGIDLIIGGHSHTFLDEPAALTSPAGERTLVTQAGHSGLLLGRIDLLRAEDGTMQAVTGGSYAIGSEEG